MVGVRSGTLPGKWRVAIQALMTYFVMNVKRMVKLLLAGGQEVGLLDTA